MAAQLGDAAPLTIRVSDAIARGGTAVILKGEALSTEHTEEPLLVALKVVMDLPKEEPNDYQERIRRELAAVQQVRHRFILPFLGTVMGNTYTVIVSPYMENGDLLEYLKAHPDANRRILIMQVAEAVDYLHTRARLVHGDLKCQNVLVSRDGHAQLADFGLSTIVDKSMSTETTALGIRHSYTLQFAAPELLSDEAKSPSGKTRSKTPPTDVFAFGRLMLQAFTGTVPWPDVHVHAVVYKILHHSIPDRPESAKALGLSDEWWSVCVSCWFGDPCERPMMSDIVIELGESDNTPEDSDSMSSTRSSELPAPHTEFSLPNIVLHPDGNVAAGTLADLVGYLVMHDNQDSDFFDSFVTTFTTFASLDAVCELLIKRFHLDPGEGLVSGQLPESRAQRQAQAVVRIRVVDTLKTFLRDDDIVSQSDVDLLNRIEEFAMCNQNVFPPTEQLLTLIGRVRRGETRRHLPSMYRNNRTLTTYPKDLKVVDVDPLELAQQMTILESDLFRALRPSECMRRLHIPRGTHLDTVSSIILTSNKIADWVVESILACDNARQRATIIEHFIKMAEYCRSLKNFSTMVALIAGLNSPPIRGLERSWKLVKKDATTFDSMETLLDPGRNFRKYGETLSETAPPCVPFIGAHLFTLTFIQDETPDLIDDGSFVNFDKKRKLADVIHQLKAFQSVPYELMPNPAILSYIKESIASTTMSADELQTLSLEREPRDQLQRTQNTGKLRRLLGTILFRTPRSTEKRVSSTEIETHSDR